jgi:type IV secretory pathway TrbL component
MVQRYKIGTVLVRQYTFGVLSDGNISQLVASVILLTLVNKLPPMLAGIVGAGGQASGIGSFGAGAAQGQPQWRHQQ